MNLDQKLIEEIIKRILAVTPAERIIIFGSAAAGKMTRDSDIDLLVLKSTPGDLRQESVQVRRALGDLGYPFDIIVIAAERFEESKGVIGGLAFPANKYGRVIYEAASPDKTLHPGQNH
jgi:predicted nucleotidyltransferase